MADQIDQDPRVEVLIIATRTRNRTAATRADNLPRNDTNLSNMDQQGIWPLLEARCTHPVLQDPVLGACIHIDPLNSVNPDCDLHPAGQYEIFQPHGTSRDLPVGIQLFSGRLAGRLSRSWTTALHTAFQRRRAVPHQNMTRNTFNCKIANPLHRNTKPAEKLPGKLPTKLTPMDHPSPSHVYDGPPTTPGADYRTICVTPGL